MPADEMANCALLVQKIEQVLPQEQRKCWPGSLVRKARPLGVIVASEHILGGGRRYVYAAGNSEV